MSQMTFNFEAGLTDQFPEWADVVRASVYGCGKPFKAVAADLDMSSSVLSRMLNEADTSMNFPVHRLADLLEATGDYRPIHWLMERFCLDTDAENERALQTLKSILPQLQSIARTAERKAK